MEQKNRRERMRRVRPKNNFLKEVRKMGVFMRILAIVAALWAIFVYYKATKNEKQLSNNRIELRALQEKYHDAQARREIAIEKKNLLRDDIRLKQREVRSLRKKLAEKRNSDANREWQEREKQERARREQQDKRKAQQEEEDRASRAQREEEERASRARRVRREERMERERARERARREVWEQERRIEYARDRLLNQVTPPYIPPDEIPKNDFGTMDRLNSAWSATIRGLIKATQKRDRKKIQELVKKLRKTADAADVFLKSAKYTQETEKVIQAVSDILQTIKKIQELQRRENSQR